MSLLEVKDLGVEFRDNEGQYRKVVEDVSFTLDAGEILGVVGESGSGKSVTALSILKLLPYPKAKNTSNSLVFYKNQNLLHCSEMELMKIRGKDIAYIFQEPMSALNPLHTIGKQLIENILIHNKINKQKAYVKALHLLKMVEIANPEERMKAYPFELSGGQRQRVMIAMAISNNPKILIADEPTTALDVTIQSQIIDLLIKLTQKMNMSMIFISHNLRLIEKIAHKVCVMQNGIIVEQGKTNEILLSPKHTYTKELLDSVNIDAKNVKKADDCVLTVNNLEVRYPIKKSLWGRVVKSISALDGVSFNLHRGETLGVIGESGSGKTTLGMCLVELLKYQGNIELEGKNIRQINNVELRKKMQIVFQDPYNSLNPRMNIEQIIGEGLRVCYPDLEDEFVKKRIIEVLKSVELNDAILNKYPHEFSGGQRQRIAIARALVLNPEILILDEPTSALDVTIQKQILQLLIKLQKQNNLSYVFISHDMNAIRAVSDRIAVMKNGIIVEIDSAENILQNPQNEYTKSLTKSIL